MEKNYQMILEKKQELSGRYPTRKKEQKTINLDHMQIMKTKKEKKKDKTISRQEKLKIMMTTDNINKS